MKYPQPIDPLYISRIPTADGTDYAQVFRGEGKRQSRIHDCCQEIEQAFKLADKDFRWNAWDKKKIAERICKKYKLDEKLIFNILKI